MPSSLGRAARLVLALVASAQGAAPGVDLALGAAPGVDLALAAALRRAPGLGPVAGKSIAGKSIAGVPVLNYQKAYTGETRSATVLGKLEQPDPSMHEEDWVVVLKQGTSQEQIQSFCQQAPGGCTSMSRGGSFPFIAVSGTEDHLAEVVGPRSHLARYIELDFAVSLDPEEDEPSEVAAASTLASWGLERVGLPSRWGGAGAGVHVYVCDTGIRTEHEDFGGRASVFADAYTNVWPHSAVLCNESADLDCGLDQRGHGTHCAGTAAGTKFGVAPEAKVHAVKVLNNSGSGTTAGIIGGLDLIATYAEKPAVVSMSLGGVGSARVYQEVIDMLISLNIPVVVSAGNDYKDACIKTPASVRNAITVGSTDSLDARSSFSNFGVCVDLWAPGSDIISAQGDAEFPGNDANTTKSGTSMATPHVAGAAALLLEANPTLTPAEVLAAMRANASLNYITDLSPTDQHNQLLYVGSPQEPAKPEKSTESWPPGAFFKTCEEKKQDGPLGFYNVCRCADRANTQCYEGYKLGCPIGLRLDALQEERGNTSNFSLAYFEWNCTTCNCYSNYYEKDPEPEKDGHNWMVICIVAAVLIELGVLAWVLRPAGEGRASGEVEIPAAP